jgi:hypothetical protein
MAEITEEDIKEHLNNLINALYALSPTRNYVLQLLELLPRDYPKMVDAYPELFKDEKIRNRLKDVLGIKISENVEVGYDLAKKLREISENVRSQFFELYSWEGRQKKLSEYLGRDLDDLPNVIDELWEQRIQMAISEPTYGTDCEKILRTMVNKGEGSQFSLNISTVIEETGLDRSTLLRIKSFLTKDIGILDGSEEVFRFVYQLSNAGAFIKRVLGE